MLTVPEALRLLLDAVEPLPAERVPLDRARGRTLAEDVTADRDHPPTDRSAMDGFALRAADAAVPGTPLRLAGEIRAGECPDGVRVVPGAAMRIFTGAVIPDGADAVVMVERTSEDRAARTVTVEERPVPGQNIRRRGEDLRAGARVVARGSLLRAAEIAALASVGCAQVPVGARPRVALLSTGDEIVPVEAVPAPHQVRNSNASMLRALLEETGAEAVSLDVAGDERGALDAAVLRGLAHDVLLISGGVSVGAYDLVGEALQSAGCEVLVRTVAMRPGKPVLIARRGACLVVGLPGNPVSAFTGFHVFVAPALRKLAGDAAPVRPLSPARLATPMAVRAGRRVYGLAHVQERDGATWATPTGAASSGDVTAIARANAFIVAEGELHLTPGDAVDVLRWGA